MRDVHAFVDGNDIECLLELRQPFLSHRHSSVVQFVLKDNVAICFIGSVLVSVNPAFKVAVNRGGRKVTATITGHVPVVGIFVPNDGTHTHLPSDRTNTVIDIAIRRTPASRSDSSGFLNCAKSPVKLCNYLVIGHGGHLRVGPGMNTDSQAIGNSSLSSSREADDIGADVF